MERIDKIGHIDYGRVKWINALYMTAQLNNSYVYAYNSPVRWVDILGLRPGDVFYSIEEAALDAATYIYEVAGPSPEREWGTLIKEVKEPFYGMENVCVQAYTYEEPTPGDAYSWTPKEFLNFKNIVDSWDIQCNALVYLHTHIEGTIIGPSYKDIWSTKNIIGRLCRHRYLFSLVIDSNFNIWGIGISGDVFEF